MPLDCPAPRPAADRRAGRRRTSLLFASATTGPANLLAAVAAADLNALYHFMSDIIGALTHISTIEVTPILSGVKRTGLVRPGSL
ncbi:Lrp/AsnC ligand binding domain-containing protein [Streptomyces sp. JA03]|nr:Lrp/AsnC ligand binding domain-containing protein [Streptomyces barringtoniae]MCC5479185.1 Lrp/AsnC ligand binding domain-containing protein [Streptomyces barringtoniae]